MRAVNNPRGTIGVALAAFMVYAPFLYYRYTLEHAKRLRPITEGRVYRSGCMSADGFRDAIHLCNAAFKGKNLLKHMHN